MRRLRSTRFGSMRSVVSLVVVLDNFDSLIERTEHGRLDTQLQDRPCAELRVFIDVVVLRHIVDIHRELTSYTKQRIARTNLVEERLPATALDPTTLFRNLEDIVVILTVVRRDQVLHGITQRTTLLVRRQKRQQAAISTIRSAQTRFATTNEIDRIEHRCI